MLTEYKKKFKYIFTILMLILKKKKYFKFTSF